MQLEINIAKVTNFSLDFFHLERCEIFEWACGCVCIQNSGLIKDGQGKNAKWIIFKYSIENGMETMRDGVNKIAITASRSKALHRINYASCAIWLTSISMLLLLPLYSFWPQLRLFFDFQCSKFTVRVRAFFASFALESPTAIWCILW